MNRILLLLTVVLALWCHWAEAQSAWLATEKQSAEKQGGERQSAEQKIFNQLNHARKENGLPALEWNEQAAIAARIHAQSLLENGKLSHQFAGEPPLPERIGATGVRFTLAAENVARTEYVEDVHLALMGSPGHRANILSPRYNAVGIGMVEKAGKIYVTQDFIFLIATYSEEQFSAAFTETFNLARKSKGVRLLEPQSNASLRELACATNGDATKLADKITGAVSVAVFTASDPHSLPEQMLHRAANSDFHRMNFGVCFRPDQEHGYANFWVVATFGM